MNNVPYLSYMNNASNYGQMPWMSNNFGMQNQYGMMPDTSLNFMQDYSYEERVAKAEAKAKAEAETKVKATAKAEAEAKKPEVVKFVTNPESHGKVSFGRAASHILKGAGNFFKGMVCDENGKFSLKRTLTTVGVGLACAAVCAIPGGALALGALGTVIGGVQVTKGIVKAANAKTDAQADAAYEDIGAGATGVALSIVGAKGGKRFSWRGFIEDAKSIIHPVKSIKTGYQNVKTSFTRSEVKNNVLNKELEPITTKLTKLERKLAKEENRANNERIFGRKASEKRIEKYTEEIAKLEKQKALLENSKETNLTRAQLDEQKQAINDLEKEIKANKAELKESIKKNESKELTEEQVQTQKDIEAVDLTLKENKEIYALNRRMFPYDRAVYNLSNGTTRQLITASVESTAKNFLLATSRYAKPTIYNTQAIAGNIYRDYTPDGIIEAYTDAKTGLEIDPSTLNSEQKKKARLIKQEELENEIKKAVEKDIKEKTETEKKAA